jgi:hypothetical protein
MQKMEAAATGDRTRRRTDSSDAQPLTLTGALALLPCKEIVTSSLMAAPCLALIFANIFVLWPSPRPSSILPQPVAPPPSTSAAGNDSEQPLVATRPYLVMEIPLFADFPQGSREDEAAAKQHIKHMFFLAAAIGSCVAGLLADVAGRRVVTVSFFTTTVLAGLLASQAPTLGSFYVFWLAAAASMMGAYVVTYVRVVELLPTRLRVVTALVVFGSVWAMARFLAIFFAWLTKDWSPLIFFLSFFTCTVLLLSHLLGSGAKGWRLLAEQSFAHLPAEANNERPWHILTHRRLWPHTLVCAYGFFICGVVFYGFNLARKVFVSSDVFVDILFTGFVDFAAEMLVAVACKATGRTLAVFNFFMFLNGLCCLAAAPFEVHEEHKKIIVCRRTIWPFNIVSSHIC